MGAYAVGLTAEVIRLGVSANLACEMIDFLVFQVIKNVGFVTYAVFLCFIQSEINAIECISRIDRKIKRDYTNTVNQLKFLMFFQIIV